MFCRIKFIKNRLTRISKANMKSRYALFILFFFPIIGLIGVKTGNLNYVFLPFIFGLIAKGLDLKDIIKCYFVFCWILIVGTFLCCHMGLLENMVSFREEKVRNSFGFIYATDFAAHIFYLVLMYFYLRSGKFNLIEIMLFFVFIFFYCKSMWR